MIFFSFRKAELESYSYVNPCVIHDANIQLITSQGIEPNRFVGELLVEKFYWEQFSIQQEDPYLNVDSYLTWQRFKCTCFRPWPNLPVYVRHLDLVFYANGCLEQGVQLEDAIQLLRQV